MASGAVRASEMPRALPTADSDIYRHVFTLQAQGNMHGAAALMDKISDKRLLGHVLAQRYLHPAAYRSSYKELRQWLDQYADYPQAARIYALAMRKRAADAPPPRRPVFTAVRSGTAHEVIKEYRSPALRSKAAVQKRAVIHLRLKGLLKKSDPDAAYAYLQSGDAVSRLDAVEIDIERQAIAEAYFGEGRDEDALQLASEAAARNGRIVPEAHWTAGLAAWRLGRMDQSVTHFSAMADGQSPYADQASLTAAAYWAARANLAVRQPQRVNQHLQTAARYPHTLYGMLAYRQLGKALPFDWSLPPVTQMDIAALQRHPGFGRVLALREAGQTALADKEMQLLHNRLGPENDERLLAVAGSLKLPQSLIRIAETARANGNVWMAGLYPLPDWRPHGGFKVDAALLYAIARKESNFVATAEGKGGARGLMQLMPATARFVSRARGLPNASRDQLFDPEYNLTLGQYYLKYLVDKTGRSDLFSLIASYNAGPGVVENWQQRSDKVDTLLFLESLPYANTRQYVAKVLADYWIYQHRMGVPGNSLDAVAEGSWPQL
ncbi:MAG: lytic transglycosylase domain-containing protein [Alphaproteobacteria bacterium]|nr:lytic transglycosylase domain-containing protein [Alphaproteobacteria bacterium]